MVAWQVAYYERKGIIAEVVIILAYLQLVQVDNIACTVINNFDGEL